MAIPASTKKGVSVSAFPDVCFIPAPSTGSPNAIPYPSVGMQSNVSVAKRDVTGKIALKSSTVGRSTGGVAGPSSIIKEKTEFVMSSMDVKFEGKGVARSLDLMRSNNPPKVNQLRSRLQTITSQLVRMPGGNPDQWHELVDEYVVVSAELYLEMSK